MAPVATSRMEWVGSSTPCSTTKYTGCFAAAASPGDLEVAFFFFPRRTRVSRARALAAATTSLSFLLLLPGVGVGVGSASRHLLCGKLEIGSLSCLLTFRFHKDNGPGITWAEPIMTHYVTSEAHIVKWADESVPRCPSVLQRIGIKRRTTTPFLPHQPLINLHGGGRRCHAGATSGS